MWLHLAGQFKIKEITGVRVNLNLLFLYNVPFISINFREKRAHAFRARHFLNGICL